MQPLFAPPAPPPGTFRSLYSDDDNDPYSGRYAAVMTTFRDGNNALAADALYHQVLSVGVETSNAYIGIFKSHGEECGRSLLLHGIAVYPSVLGQPTQWDGQAFAFVQDVVDNDIVTAHFPVNYFHRTRGDTYTRIPNSFDQATALFSADPEAELFDQLPADHEHAKAVCTRHLMYVPPKYIPIVIGRRMTPTQLFTDLLGAIEQEDDLDACAPLVEWVLMAATRKSPNRPSSLRLPLPVVPMADSKLLRHRRRILHHQLPSLRAPGHQGASDAATAQLVDFVGQLVDEQRLSRTEAANRQAATRAPKLPSAFWNEADVRRLCTMCDVDNEADLPELWLSLAAAGKHDRLALERCLKNAAECRDHMPIATPELTKKIVALCFSSDNRDNLSKGIQPFILALRDTSTADREQATADAKLSGEEYDQLMQGTTATDLADLCLLRNTSKISFTYTCAQAKQLLLATSVLFKCLLGADHPLHRSFASFVRHYTNQEHSLNECLRKITHGPSAFLRFTQVHLVEWFCELDNCTHRPPPEPPNFMDAIQGLRIGNNSWVPYLPPKYLPALPCAAPTKPPPAAAGASAAAATKDAAAAAPRTPAKNTAAAAAVKFNKCIKAHGAPPNITKNGITTPMCASYHLRNLCYSNCARATNHGPHTEGKDKLLLAWAQKALA